MSREEDFKKVEEGIKLLTLSFQRLVDKFQHLDQTVRYLGDDLLIFRNNLQVLSGLFSKLQEGREEKPKKAKEEVKVEVK